MRMVKIGVLSLQGSVEEHLAMLKRLPEVEGLPVKNKQALETVDGIILPGGESTAIGKLLQIFSLKEPLQKRIAEGMPVWGTCAGMILLAKHIVGEEACLGTTDITVRRNSFGRQIDSFSVTAPVEGIGIIPLVFIRAPWAESADSPEVQVLCKVKGHIVAARQRNMLATAYHPELTENTATHRYFAAMCRQTQGAI